MSDPKAKLIVALLAMRESTASTLHGMHDLLLSAGRDWELVTHGAPGEPKIRCVVVSADGRRFRTDTGLWVDPECAFSACPQPDVTVVLDLMVAPEADIAGRYAAETEWLRACYRLGATLAAACSGALLLAEAGLLDGQDATTHWAYCDSMAARYPAVRMHPNRALVISGDEQRLVLAGGGTSWYDLGLFLVARFLGVEEAMRVARLHLLDWHKIGQLPYAALARRRQAQDAVIAECQAWIAGHYDEEAPVGAMARCSGLPERSFKRRFTAATGMSPIEYVHTLRLEEAKQMLEATSLPIEAVANEVGYEDASFFGRLFRRKVGLTPAQYRKRFGALRQQLWRAERAGRAEPGATHVAPPR